MGEEKNSSKRLRVLFGGKVFWPVIMIIISFFVGNILDIAVLDVLVCTLNPPQTSVRILEPENLAEIHWHPYGYPVKGVYSGFKCKRNLDLHMLVNPSKTDLWWVQNPIRLFPDGTWEAYAYFGTETQEGSEEYRILVVAADQGAFERETAISKQELNELGPFVNHSIWVRRPGKETELSVLYPLDGQKVAWTTPVFGRVIEIDARPDLALCLLVFPEESDGPWYVQDPPYLAETGEWVGLVYIGRDPKDTTQDVGKEFRLAVILTERELSAGETMNALPANVACIQILKLTRK